MFLNSDLPLSFINVVSDSLLAEIDCIDIFDREIKREWLDLIKYRSNVTKFKRVCENHNRWVDAFIKAWKKTRADIIIGSRFVKGGKFKDKRLWKKLLSPLVNQLINIILGVKIMDKTSGFRLIKREAVEKVRIHLQETGYPSYMEFILFAHKFGFKIKEVPIVYVPRKWGKSKMNKITTLFEYLHFGLRILSIHF